jgi:diguanylate cyclase (GGDEF)-like protein
LERFKKFNDNLGRPAGDALLKQVADWLAQNAGNASVLARVGADHFAVVLPDVTSEGEVFRLLDRTVTAFLSLPFNVNDVVYRIAAKVGVALHPDDGGDADTVFKNAEAARGFALRAGIQASLSGWLSGGPASPRKPVICHRGKSRSTYTSRPCFARPENQYSSTACRRVIRARRLISTLRGPDSGPIPDIGSLKNIAPKQPFAAHRCG